jgi:hypothetical protein
MSRQLNQARGFAAEIAIGIESVFNTPAATGKLLAHNGSTITATRETNVSDTIVANRSSTEPFQGNGDVAGAINLPNDLNQMGLILKGIFGKPVSTAPADAAVASAVADEEDGTVTLTVAKGHGVVAGDYFCVYGTTNYNGEFVAISATETTIVFTHTYTAEILTTAYVSKTGYSHVYKIGRDQPSMTFEQVHTDLAEMFLYTGCMASRLTIGADSNGQENVVTVDIMGSKPAVSVVPVVIDKFEMSGDGSSTLITTKTVHGLSTGNCVVIAGSSNYNGRYAVASAPTTTTFTIAKAYVAESVTASSEPVGCKTHFVNPVGIPLKRLNTFSGKVYKDGVEYKTAKTFTIEFDMGLDGDQRVIGDNGFRSEIPEGKVGITTSLTALLKNADWYRLGEGNITVALKLAFAASFGIGSLTIEIPENKVSMASPGVDSPNGIIQQITAIGFATDSSATGSAAIITLVSPYATF